MARSKEDINKSQAIRDALRTNPEKTPSGLGGGSQTGNGLQVVTAAIEFVKIAGSLDW